MLNPSFYLPRTPRYNVKRRTVKKKAPASVATPTISVKKGTCYYSKTAKGTPVVYIIKETLAGASGLWVRVYKLGKTKVNTTLSIKDMEQLGVEIPVEKAVTMAKLLGCPVSLEGIQKYIKEL